MIRWIANATQSTWRAFTNAVSAPRKGNRSSPPLRTRITQDQVGEWKRQVTPSIRFRDGNARDLDLSGSAWKGEDFTNCDLRDANLSRCDFKDANFEGAELWNVDLSSSDLTGVTNLLPEQLAATNLKGAKLSDSLAKFEALEASAKLADNASNVFLVMLGAIAFAFLTLATAKDWQLITNNGNTKLPVIGVEVAIRDFCWAIPILLFALFVYFHIYLQRLWEALATLPAVFPDGRRLDERSNPWLVSALMRTHLRWVQSQSVALSGLQYVLSMTLGYWVMSITVFALLCRLCFLRNLWITASQLVMLGLGTGLGFYFLANRWETFKDRAEKLRGLPRVFHWLCGGRGVYGGVAAVLFGLGLSCTILQETRADLRDVDLHGAYLVAADFYNADFHGGHFEGADLDYANLLSANLEDAHFKGAHFTGASASNANFEGGDFREAFFQDANLEDANLTKAELENCHLEHANLASANLEESRLDRAHLNYADLKKAWLGNANLEGAGLKGAYLDDAHVWNAHLKDADLREAHLKGANLKGADLRHATLEGADLEGANLDGAVVSDLNDLKGAKGAYSGKPVINPKDN